MDFLDACNIYARERHINISFFEDLANGWVAKMKFEDTNGLYFAFVDEVAPKEVTWQETDPETGKKKKKTRPEKFEEYRDRIRPYLEKAAVDAHKSRMSRKAA